MVECWYWFILKAFIWLQLRKHGTRLCGMFVYIIMSFVYEWCLVFDCSWIFVKKGKLDVLGSWSTIFIDASYKAEPPNYGRQLTVFVTYDVFSFPLIYVLLTRETVALYVKVFEKLKQLVPLVPTTAIVGPLSIVQLSTANLHFSDYNSLHSYKRTIMDRCFVDVLVSMNRLYFGDIGLLECYHHCSNSYYRLLVIISG